LGNGHGIVADQDPVVVPGHQCRVPGNKVGVSVGVLRFIRVSGSQVEQQPGHPGPAGDVWNHPYISPSIVRSIRIATSRTYASATFASWGNSFPALACRAIWFTLFDTLANNV